LGAVADINPRHPKGIDDTMLVSFVPMAGLNESQPGFQFKAERPFGTVRKGFTHFAEGDVLFAKITPCMENGKGAVARGLRNRLGCGTTELHVIRPLVGISPEYIYRFGGILSCLDAQNGKVLWRKQSTDDYQGIPYKSDAAMSPLLEGGMCFMHLGGKTNGALFAFDLINGSPKWKWTGDGPASSSPVVMTVQSTKQLVTLTAKSVVGLSLADGKLLWQIPFEAVQGNNTTSVVSEQTVIYTGQGKGTFAVRIEGQGSEFAAIPLWTNKQIGARFTTPVLKDGLLYGYNGHFSCANAKTGTTLWEDATNRGNSAAVVDAGSIILALTVNSELVAFKPSDKEYIELAHFKVADTETWAHPVVSGSRVFVRDRESVALWTIE
jgi:hypothetical protein